MKKNYLMTFQSQQGSGLNKSKKNENLQKNHPYRTF